MKIISELLIDGKENFECACCHNIFYCDDAVMLKDNLNDERLKEVAKRVADEIAHRLKEEILGSISYGLMEHDEEEEDY